MRRVYVGIAGLFVALLLLYFGNFIIATSQTYENTVMGGVQDLNTTFVNGFCVYPDSHFGKLVASELRTRGYKVLILATPMECDGQFLAVWVESINITYSPFLARGSVEVVALYSGNGNPSFYLNYTKALDKKPVLQTLAAVGNHNAYIVSKVYDESKGVIGFIGYQEHLLKLSAGVIVDYVEGLSRNKAVE